MVNLKEKPFYLNDEQISRIESIYNNMSLDEKIGQLFILLKPTPGYNEDELTELINDTKFGGFRWQNQDALNAYKQNTFIRKNSIITPFVAANCDDGGNGAVPNGTFVATAIECSASNDIDSSYKVGYVAGSEASAVGANFMFNPVVDIYKNFRNTIVNTRSYGENKENVLNHARAYIKGVKAANPNMACTAKHFPGDGVEELDQHIAMGVNTLSVDEWNNSFGYVYQNLINDGIEAIMVGHIALPEMSRYLVKGIKDEDIKPATLSKELLDTLLRKQMGFNGLIITDATHMIGFSAMEQRKYALPKAIEAGCDMLLFANDFEEDKAYMIEAYNNKTLSENRIKDAIFRILGLKFKLNMDKTLPSIEGLDVIGNDTFKSYTKSIAQKAITLVKDTRSNLPLNPKDKKNCFLVYIGNTPNSKGYNGDKTKDMIKEELENAGFSVDVCPSFYDLEVKNGVSFMNMIEMMNKGKIEDFKKNHDFCLMIINTKGYAQENEVRLRYSMNHSKEMPWYNEEIPTIAVSLNYTNHLLDIPNVHTYINAYGSDKEIVKLLIQKMIGNDEFLGKFEENVFCNRFDTKL